jgi:hypothetical protein
MYERLKELSDARAEYIELFKTVLETLVDNKVLKSMTPDNVLIDLECYSIKSKELFEKIEKLKLEAEIEAEDNGIRILFEKGLIKKVETLTKKNIPLEILKELMFEYMQNGCDTIITKEHYQKIIRAVHILERAEKRKKRNEPQQIGL